MPSARPRIALATTLAVVFLLSLAATAQTYSVLYDFNAQGGPSQGYQPGGGVVLDAQGNMYGTTVFGGAYECFENQSCGIVFQLLPDGQGHWSYQQIYYFTGGTDGGWPGGPMIVDRRGSVYGSTSWSNNQGNHRSVFQLSQGMPGTWNFSTLYRGSGPSSPTIGPNGLMYAADGNLMLLGQLSATRWYSLVLNPNGGNNQVAFDSAGKAYSTQGPGGLYNYGAVIAYSPRRGAQGYDYSAIYAFTGGSDGYQPTEGVAVDSAGNLYGTTLYGGANNCHGGCGTVYKMTHNQDGSWTKSMVHVFQGGTGDGWFPGGPPNVDTAGNVYVTATYGGPTGDGYVLRFSPGAGGQWTETVLHTFLGGVDGAFPNGWLTFDASGNIFGTTVGIGNSGNPGHGLVYEISR